MASENQHEFFGTLLDTAIERRVSGVEILGEIGEIEAPFKWEMLVPGVNLCLSGTQSLVFKRDKKLVELNQNAREGFAMVPGCWFGTRPQRAHESLQIRFNTDTTYFGYNRFAEPIDLSLFPHNDDKRAFVSPAKLDPLGHEIYRLLLTPPLIGSQEYLRSLFEALLCKAREALFVAPVGSKSRQSWCNACDFIENHCGQPLSREEVADYLKVHPNYLSQLFATQGGESFSSFLLRVRLERARHLLNTPGLNVAEVGRLCGFPNSNYFIRAFKKRYGVTPGRARYPSELPRSQN